MDLVTRTRPPGDHHPGTVDAAQAVSYGRESIPGEPGEPAHPLARHTYELRSLIRHRACKRRMCGVTRTTGTYYLCPHDTRNPRHAAAAPDHPRTVTIREDHLYAALAQFFDEWIFGPERAALLADLLPANAAADAARTEKHAAGCDRRLRQIDAAEKARTDEMEALATSTADPKAIKAMRERHLERFTELETERAQIKTELTALSSQHARLISPELLDALPIIPAILAELPPKLRRRLYQAFDISIVYKHDTSQATYRATITTSTPATVAAIIHDSHNAGDDTRDLSSDSACVPMTTAIG